MELRGFGVERGLKKAMWEECTREIANMMAQTPYQGYQGEFFDMPPRNVIPKPLQNPHPPLWVAASRRETTMLAARFGMGSLGFGFETPEEELAERTDEYYRIVRDECLPIGHAINPGLAVLTTFMMGRTDEEALERSANGPAFFSHSLGYYYNPVSGGRHQPGEKNLYDDFLAANERDNTLSARTGFVGEDEIRKGEPKDEVQRALYRAARSGTAVGTVERVRETLKTYEDNHLDVMIFVAQCGDRRHEHIMESIERFGRELLPEGVQGAPRDRACQVARRAARRRRLSRPLEHLTVARTDQIQDERLRELVVAAHRAMRDNEPTEAMHGLVEALYRLLEVNPALATEQIEPRPGWKLPFLSRWPQYGANWKSGSLAAGKPEIEFIRERFALSEAITCYEFLLDTAIKRSV